MDENRNYKNRRRQPRLNSSAFRRSPVYEYSPPPSTIGNGNYIYDYSTASTPLHKPSTDLRLFRNERPMSYIPIRGNHRRSLSDINESSILSAADPAMLRSASYDDVHRNSYYFYTNKRPKRRLVQLKPVQDLYINDGYSTSRTLSTAGSISPYDPSLYSDGTYTPSIQTNRSARTLKLVPYPRQPSHSNILDINHNRQTVSLSPTAPSRNSLTNIEVVDEPEVLQRGEANKKFVVLKPESAVMGRRRAAQQLNIEDGYLAGDEPVQEHSRMASGRKPPASALSRFSIKLPFWGSKKESSRLANYFIVLVVVFLFFPIYRLVSPTEYR